MSDAVLNIRCKLFLLSTREFLFSFCTYLQGNEFPVYSDMNSFGVDTTF